MFDAYRGKTVLVSGGSGFLGHHLIQILHDVEAKIINFSLQNTKPSDVSFFSGDVSNLDNVKRVLDHSVNLFGQPIDFVFHLAGQKSGPLSYEKPYETMQVNAVGTLNLLDSLKQRDQTRSISVISSASTKPLRNGSGKTNLYSPYNISKLMAELICESYYKSFQVPVACCRLHNIYGPGQSSESVIASILSQMKSGADLELGNLSPVRDFIYVEDAAKAILELALSGEFPGKLVEVGTGIGHSIAEVIELAKQLTKFQGEINVSSVNKRVGEEDIIVADLTQLRELINWKPEYNLNLGLQRMI
ncbi:putative dTDP-glucose 4,6-dehydratase [uncultured Woeseiaceae bacterium]|uniref:Putative dTDP-glucose 4,6-dehydratase n=1 Tax=uncultured Woeseiaceae bacterium TaxID=1983305 RepID=A0A7D9D3V6_9GAMM|nr:putative dTDP-glucose 4,6-dehydratase [uncultured Woeseiaceae bacterium]